ncbi:MAG: PH domain-containing protein [Alkalimonas sp.]|nr:PH domain-containing protein [Alkalimonas sp.]
MDTSTFSNLSIDETRLPDIEQLDWQPLSPKYMLINLRINLIGTLLLTAIWAALLFQPFWTISPHLEPLILWIGTGLTLLGLLFSVHGRCADPCKAYALREHDVSFQSGLFFRKSVTQPILRIQHIELKRGPIERRIGLATLQVFSAGGVMHTFEIPGLPLSTAKSLRQFILQHKDTRNHG